MDRHEWLVMHVFYHLLSHSVFLCPRLPRYACHFIEMCLMVTADHGPAVSGAHNTIICARAGKDLISSLTSGLLTIVSAPPPRELPDPTRRSFHTFISCSIFSLVASCFTLTTNSGFINLCHTINSILL